MSYDLNLVRLPPGADPQSVAAASARIDEETELNPGEPDAAKEERKRRLAANLRAVNPTLHAFQFDHTDLARIDGTTEQEARRRFRHIELNGPEDSDGIQIILFDDTASVTVPYWHQGDKARHVWREIWSYLEVLRRQGDFQVYDPQLQRALSLEADFEAVLRKYHEGVAFTDRVAADLASPSPRAKPWWRFW